MKLSVFTVSMPEYDIEQSALLLKKLGYNAVEWRVADVPEKFPENVPFEGRYWACNHSTLNVKDITNEAKRAKAACDAAGIKMLALTTYLPTNQYEKFDEVFAAAKETGCEFVRIGLAGFNPAKTDKTYPEAFDAMRADMKVIEGIAAKYGVKALNEIHMDSLISSPSAAYRALEGLDPAHIGLIYDPGNMVYEGYEDTLKSFQLLGKYIAHIHIKNGLLVKDGENEFGAAKYKRQWMPLDKGSADLYNVFCCAKKMGFDGYFSLEDFSNEDDTETKLAKAQAFVEKLYEAADPEKAY